MIMNEKQSYSKESLRVKRWREKYPEKAKKARKRYQKKNREKIREYYRKWRKKNTKKTRGYSHTYYRKKHPIVKRFEVAENGEGWIQKRKEALERDNYTCQVCGGKATEVHHIDGTGSNRPEKERNNNLDNLLSVCHKCHIQLDLKRFENGFNKGEWHEKKERNKKIYWIYKNTKMSQTKISKIFGVTRQRVYQIIKKKDREERY